LKPGANLVTWPGADASPAQALASQPGLQVIYGYDPETKTWRRWGPGFPAYVNNLTTLVKGGAYWFIASKATEFTPAGMDEGDVVSGTVAHLRAVPW
jgi:hypothetical protein